MNPRAIAALQLVLVIRDGRSLTDVLSSLPQAHPDLSELGLVKALCYEVLRWYLQLQTLLTHVMDKPLKDKDLDVQLLLMVGLCQILFLRTPDHAAVTETVNATKDLKKPWAAKLINAVLRNFLRQQTHLMTEMGKSPASQYAHPNWLIKQLKRAWPNDWESLLEANNAHPPFSLRINQQETTREQFIKQLSDVKLETTISPVSDVSLILNTPTDVTALPGFSAGFFSVQDISPQLAAPLLDLKPSQRVLDACAAPGGKTLHILETEPDIAELVAIDISETRLEKAKESWLRLKLADKITWIAQNAEEVEQWWDGNQFDRILLDAPCSATGVIRRHPDIKLLRKAADIQNLTHLQTNLLNALWKTLKPNGILLYATCSILPQENTDVIEAFLNTHTDASEVKIQSNWGVACEFGKQILTGQDNMDGFYYAKLRKG